jgi:hypothetical protein
MCAWGANHSHTWYVRMSALNPSFTVRRKFVHSPVTPRSSTRFYCPSKVMACHWPLATAAPGARRPAARCRPSPSSPLWLLGRACMGPARQWVSLSCYLSGGVLGSLYMEESQTASGKRKGS